MCQLTPPEDPHRAWRFRFAEKPAVELTPPLIARFLATIAHNPATAAKATTAAKALAPVHRRFNTTGHLLPALELPARKTAAIPEGARDVLWQHCAEDLLSRAEFPPKVPKDWAQNVSPG